MFPLLYSQNASLVCNQQLGYISLGYSFTLYRFYIYHNSMELSICKYFLRYSFIGFICCRKFTMYIANMNIVNMYDYFKISIQRNCLKILIQQTAHTMFYWLYSQNVFLENKQFPPCCQVGITYQCTVQWVVCKQQLEFSSLGFSFALTRMKISMFKSFLR